MVETIKIHGSVRIDKLINKLIKNLENEPGWFYNNDNKLALKTWMENEIVPLVNEIREHYVEN